MTGGSSARKPLIAGNWKMNNTHFEGLTLVQKLAFTLTSADYDAAEVVVLPPFTALRSVQTLVAGDKLRIGYGAQDLSPHDKGAYTGDVSGPMLAKLGCSYVLAGHSERRQYHAEDDALVNAKTKAAFRAEMTPILCVGEHLEIRRAGGQLGHCLSQLDGGLAGLSVEQVDGAGGGLRAGLGHRHRGGRVARGRAGSVRGDSRPCFRESRRRSSRKCAYPVWRVGEGRQHRCDHDAA